VSELAFTIYHRIPWWLRDRWRSVVRLYRRVRPILPRPSRVTIGRDPIEELRRRRAILNGICPNCDKKLADGYSFNIGYDFCHHVTEEDLRRGEGPPARTLPWPTKTGSG
jgi:hypothetical protein